MRTERFVRREVGRPQSLPQLTIYFIGSIYKCDRHKLYILYREIERDVWGLCT